MKKYIITGRNRLWVVSMDGVTLASFDRWYKAHAWIQGEARHSQEQSMIVSRQPAAAAAVAQALMWHDDIDAGED